MARKSTTEERQNYVARQRGFDPVLTEENYRVDVLEYTNYHNKNTEYKHIRKWALDYVGTVSPKLQQTVNQATDFELRSIGVFGRAIMRGDYVSADHKTKILYEVHKLTEKYNVTKTVTKVVDTTQTKPVIDKTAQLVSKHIAEVNAAIDDYITKDIQFSMKGYIAGNNVTGPVCKQVGQNFVKLQKELKEAVDGKDSQLNEGYAYLGKVKLKRFLALVQQIIVDCAQQVVTAKVRKPRTVKVKPAHVIVAKMKYLKDFPALKLVSERPETIVGADTVWLYDTVKRKLAVYVAEKGASLSVKGTTITGFDIKESGQKTLRKPEVVLTGNYAKRTLQTAYKNVKAVQAGVNGRTNENQIILKAFK